MTTPPEPEDVPSLETVLDWAEGRLDAARAAPVERALAEGDRRVVGVVEWFAGFRVAARVTLTDPPLSLHPRLEAVFERWKAAQARSRPRHVRVRLVFDSRQDLALAGVRGADADDATVHLAYTSEQAEVVLDVERLDHRAVRVRGQVLRARSGPASGIAAEARGPSGVVSSSRGDALGRFELPRVPDDADELHLDDRGSVLVVDLDLHLRGDG